MQAAECSSAPGEAPQPASSPCQLSLPAFPALQGKSLLCQPGSALLDTHSGECVHQTPLDTAEIQGMVLGCVARPALSVTNPFTKWVFHSNRDFPLTQAFD